MRTLQKLTVCEFQGLQNVTVRLCDLADFDKPVMRKTRWGKRLAAVTVHVTPLLIDTFLEGNPEFWLNQMTLFAIIWVLAERDRAFRLKVALAYENTKTEIPFELQWTLDFIEYGVKEFTPGCIVKLKENLNHYSPAVYETLHQIWSKYSSKVSQYESFWIPVESGMKGRLEISPTAPTWLASGDKLMGIPGKTQFQWMDQIIVCFTLLARMHPHFGIVLKKIKDSDTQLIFYVEKGDVYYFVLLLEAIDSVPKKMERQKRPIITEQTSFSEKAASKLEAVEESMSVVPFIRHRTIDMLNQAVKNFKKGKIVMGLACAGGAAVSAAADIGTVLQPLAKAVLPAKHGKAASKVIGKFNITAHKTANLTSKALFVGNAYDKMTQPSQEQQKQQAQQAGKGQKKNSGRKTCAEVSDEGLLLMVFPLLAQDILGAQ